MQAQGARPKECGLGRGSFVCGNGITDHVFKSSDESFKHCFEPEMPPKRRSEDMPKLLSNREKRNVSYSSLISFLFKILLMFLCSLF